MMVAPYRTEGDSFRAEKPRLLSDTRITARPRSPSRDVDVHPDGQRFAVSPRTQNLTVTKQDKVVFVFNFFEQLKRLTGTKIDFLGRPEGLLLLSSCGPSGPPRQVPSGRSPEPGR